MVHLVKLVREKSVKAFRRKTYFSLVCMNVLHHVDKKPFCSMSLLKFRWTSTSNNLYCFHGCVRNVCFPRWLRQAICQTLLSWNVSKITNTPLNKLPFATWESYELFPSCSSKWVVLAVVTRFFASILMWMSATSPDMSIHNPGRNWYVPTDLSWMYTILPRLLRVRFS